MHVLDSDLLIAFLNGEKDAFRAVKKLEDGLETAATTIFNAQELLYGALLTKNSSENYGLTREFLLNFKILDYDFESMEKSVELRASLKKSGEPIGLMDEMIAGICLRNKANIITRNKKHFSRIRGLKVMAW